MPSVVRRRSSVSIARPLVCRPKSVRPSSVRPLSSSSERFAPGKGDLLITPPAVGIQIVRKASLYLMVVVVVVVAIVVVAVVVIVVVIVVCCPSPVFFRSMGNETMA